MKKFKALLTKQNIIIATVVVLIIAAIMHLGGWNYLKDIFSSRAGGVYVAENGEEEKDISNFTKPNQCTSLYPWGPPVVNDNDVNARSLFMCRSSYAIQYDPKIKVPLWEVEILRSANMVAFNVPPSFGPSLDPDIPTKMQASLADYINSGYNFGFLAPVENMYMNRSSMHVEELEKMNKTSLKESFYMTNAVPEARATSAIRKLIDIEARKLVMQKYTLYLVSGPVFLNGKTNGFIGTGKDKIAIPTHIFKIVTYPQSHGSIAYLIPNTNDLKCDGICTPANFIVPIKEVERVTGIEFYSKLSKFYAVQVKQDINELFKQKEQK